MTHTCQILLVTSVVKIMIRGKSRDIAEKKNKLFNTFL